MPSLLLRTERTRFVQLRCFDSVLQRVVDSFSVGEFLLFKCFEPNEPKVLTLVTVPTMSSGFVLYERVLRWNCQELVLAAVNI